MTDLLPHTAREPVIREASSQQGRLHLTSHEGGKKRRTAGGRTETEEPPECPHTERWQSPAFSDDFAQRKKKKHKRKNVKS